MRVLITGMTSRTTSLTRTLAFPRLLARELWDSGVSVTMTNERKPVEGYDAVIVGIASPLAPGSTYLVPAALTIEAALDHGNLAAVLLDDPDVNKVKHASHSVLRAPDRLARQFYMSRPGMRMFSTDSAVQGYVLRCVQRMAEWDWSTVLWPGHAWAADTISSKVLGSALRLDMTPTLERVLSNDRAVHDALAGISAEAPGTAWIGESTYFPFDQFDPSLTRSVIDLSIGDRDLTKIAEMFALGYGVLQNTKMSPGWWTPTPLLAQRLARVYFPHPSEGLWMGAAFHALPSLVEDAGTDEYNDMLREQQQTYMEKSWDRATLSGHLSGVLGQTVN